MADNPNPDSPSLSPFLDQGEIDAALQKQGSLGPNTAKPLPFDVPAAAPVSTPRARKPIDLGMLTQSEIDRALSKQDRNTDAPEQAEIEQLLAVAESDPTNFVAAEAALRKIDEVETEFIWNAFRISCATIFILRGGYTSSLS